MKFYKKAIYSTVTENRSVPGTKNGDRGGNWLQESMRVLLGVMGKVLDLIERQSPQM